MTGDDVSDTVSDTGEVTMVACRIMSIYHDKMSIYHRAIVYHKNEMLK